MSKIEKELKNLPPYISLNGCGMRLVVTVLPYEPNIIEYYRDAGDWSIEIDIRTDGKIYSIINSDDIGDEIGEFKNGMAIFYSNK